MSNIRDFTNISETEDKAYKNSAIRLLISYLPPRICLSMLVAAMYFSKELPLIGHQRLLLVYP